MDGNLLEHLLVCREWIENFCRMNRFPSDTAGACAIASGIVLQRLQAEGYECTIGYNSNHCFNLIDGDTLVDITATQFGLKGHVIDRILVDKYEDYRASYPDYYSIDKVIKTTSQLEKLQRRNLWPVEQCFSHDYLEHFNARA